MSACFGQLGTFFPSTFDYRAVWVVLKFYDFFWVLVVFFLGSYHFLFNIFFVFHDVFQYAIINEPTEAT